MTQVATPPQTLKPSAEGEGWKARPIRLKIFGNLIAEVVHKGICMYCGACIASCPIDILFHSDNEEPIMRGTCAACQVCYYSCPRIELPVAEIEQRIFGRERTADEAILGVHIGSYSVLGSDRVGTNVYSENRFVSCTFSDRKSTRLNSSHSQISYAVFC